MQIPLLIRVRPHARNGRPVAGHIRHYASGSNRPAEIEGFARVGYGVGVAAPEVSAAGEASLTAALQAGGEVFVDSGAFTADPDAAGWAAILDLYDRLAAVGGPRVAVVAPDRVGDQGATLALLRQHRGRLDALRAAGARVLVPMQGGEATLAAFHAQVDQAIGPGWTPAIPSKRAATSTRELADYLRAVPVTDLHLLGLGPTGRRWSAVDEVIARYAPTAAVTSDSNMIRAHVGRPAGGPPRRLTAAEDDQGAQIWQAANSGGHPHHDLTEEVGDPSFWMPPAERRRFAVDGGLSLEDARAFAADPTAAMEAMRQRDDWTGLHDLLTDAAYDRVLRADTSEERRRRAIVAAFPPLRKGAAMPVALEPPPTPNRQPWPFVGCYLWRGLHFDIETRQGEYREGPGWRTKMPAHYGEIRGTVGLDGDGIDVFLGPAPDAPTVYVVHQKHPGTQRIDEDKLMVGWPDQAAAVQAYRAGYDAGGFLQGVTPWPASELAAYLLANPRPGRLDTPRRVRVALRLGTPIKNRPGLRLDPVKHRWVRIGGPSKAPAPAPAPAVARAGIPAASMVAMRTVAEIRPDVASIGGWWGRLHDADPVTAKMALALALHTSHPDEVQLRTPANYMPSPLWAPGKIERFIRQDPEAWAQVMKAIPSLWEAAREFRAKVNRHHKAQEKTEQAERGYEAQGVTIDESAPPPLAKLRGRKVWLYHGTSDALVPDATASGLLPGDAHGKRSNVGAGLRDATADHVFLTAKASGDGSAEWYARNAARRHGGNPVVLRVLVDGDELDHDPDDADIPAGRFQYVISRVSPDEIMEVDGQRTMEKGMPTEFVHTHFARRTPSGGMAMVVRRDLAEQLLKLKAARAAPMHPASPQRRLGLLADSVRGPFDLRATRDSFPELLDPYQPAVHVEVDPGAVVALFGGGEGEEAEAEALTPAMLQMVAGNLPRMLPPWAVVEVTPSNARIVQHEGTARAIVAGRMGMARIPLVLRLVDQDGEGLATDDLTWQGRIDQHPLAVALCNGQPVTLISAAGRPVTLATVCAADGSSEQVLAPMAKASPGGMRQTGPAPRPGLMLRASKSNPRVRRWVKTSEDPKAQPKGKAATDPEKRVRFTHPDTGGEHVGTVLGEGKHGVTVLDQAGQSVKLKHGQFKAHDGKGSPSEQAAATEQARDAAAPSAPAEVEGTPKEEPVKDYGNGNPTTIYDLPMPELEDGFNGLSKMRRAQQTARWSDVEAEMDKRFPVPELSTASAAAATAGAVAFFTSLADQGWVSRRNRSAGIEMVQTLGDQLDKAKTSGEDTAHLMGRMVQKLVHQEIEATRRTLGDHGIRHLSRNMRAMNSAMDALEAGGIEIPAQGRVAASIAMMQHDLGYTIPAIARGGYAVKDNYHPQAGGMIYSQEVAGDPALQRAVGEYRYQVRGWIQTHSSTVIDWKRDPIGTSMRLADNTHLFQDKLPEVLFSDSRGINLMVKLHLAKQSGADWKPIRDSFTEYVEARTDIGEPQKQALVQAANEISAMTPKFLVSRLAGRDMKLRYNSATGTMDADIEQSPLRSFIGKVFGDDAKDQQFLKMLSDFGHSPDAIQQGPNGPEARLEGNNGSAILMRWTKPQTSASKAERQFAGTMEKARRQWTDIQAMPQGATRDAAQHGFLTTLEKAAQLVIDLSRELGLLPDLR